MASFMNTIIAVFKFKHLISKTPGLENFKLWFTNFLFSKLMEISQNLDKFQLNKNKNCLNISYFRQYFIHKKDRPLFYSS